MTSPAAEGPSAMAGTIPPPGAGLAVAAESAMAAAGTIPSPGAGLVVVEGATPGAPGPVAAGVAAADRSEATTFRIR
jgi:hypothetical protein